MIGENDNRSGNIKYLTSIDATLIKSTLSSTATVPTTKCLMNNNNGNVDHDQIKEKMSARTDLIINDQLTKLNDENIDDDNDGEKAKQTDIELNSTPLPLADQQHRVNLNSNLNNNNNNNNHTKCQSYCCCCCCPNTGTCTGAANCNKLLGIDLAKIQPVPKPRKCSLFGKKSTAIVGDNLEIKSAINPVSGKFFFFIVFHFVLQLALVGFKFSFPFLFLMPLLLLRCKKF